MTNVVVCQVCRSPLYRCLAIGRDYAGAPVRAEDFSPVSAGIEQPVDGQAMLCPLCGEPYIRLLDDQKVVLLLEDGSFWPHPPFFKEQKY